MKIFNFSRHSGIPQTLGFFNNQGAGQFSIFNGNERGFTLAELLVAAGILVIISSVVLAIYFPTLRAQQKSIDFARIQQESQIVLEIMAKDIRNGQIDYAYSGYGGSVDPSGEAELALKNVNGNMYVVYCLVSAQVLVNRATTPVTCTGATPISASDITVTDLDFFMKPAADPFSPAAVDIRQPRVTVVVRAQKPSGTNFISVHLQTTIPQRFTQKR